MAWVRCELASEADSDGAMLFRKAYSQRRRGRSHSRNGAEEGSLGRVHSKWGVAGPEQVAGGCTDRPGGPDRPA